LGRFAVLIWIGLNLNTTSNTYYNEINPSKVVSG
jgi:hypothetical protein